MSSKFLSKAEIFAIDDRPTKEVEIPAWKGKVRIRAWNLAQASAWGRLVNDGIQNGTGLHELYAFAVANSVVDEHGELMFTTDDVEKLNDKLPAAMEKLFNEIMAFIKVNGDDIEAAKKKLKDNPILRFKHRLSLHLGMTVARLDREMSASEFNDWLAFQHYEPFGCAVEDFRFGRLLALQYAINKAEGAPDMSPVDFFHRGDLPEEIPFDELPEEVRQAEEEAFLSNFPGYAAAKAAKLANESGDAA